MNKKLRQGNAAVELMLLLPIFISLIAFTHVTASLSRTFTYAEDVAEDIMRFDGANYDSLALARVAEGGLDACRRRASDQASGWIFSKRGRSWGEVMMRISRMPASIRVESG